MPESLVDYRVDGSVAVVTMAAPHRNALTPEFADELAGALARAEDDSSVSALALLSDGPSFCSGADLGLLRSVSTDPLADGAYDGLGRIYDLFVRLVDARIPTVAGVNGAAVGAGINLALACDVRIVGDDLRVAGFGRAGVHPGGGHLTLLTERLVSGAGAGVALFGQELTASSAVACGFALEEVRADELHRRTVTFARGAGADGKLARRLTATYRTVQKGLTNYEGAVLAERAPQLWSLRKLSD
jgi:enoyl-CoA hydratase